MSALRERNRKRAREDLQDAGVQLFRERGYSATTVAAIADEAEVSRRTFFRYFRSKEDLALSLEDEDRRVWLTRLAERPRSESPLEALSRAMLETMSCFDGPENLVAAERLMGSQRLIAADPDLHAAYLRREAVRGEEASRILAERMDLDPEADYLPRLWVALFAGVTHVALEVLLKSHEPGRPLNAQDVFRELFVASGLFGPAQSDNS